MEKVNPIPPSVEEMRTKYQESSDKAYNSILTGVNAGISKHFDSGVMASKIYLKFRTEDIELAGFNRVSEYFKKYGYTLNLIDRDAFSSIIVTF